MVVVVLLLLGDTLPRVGRLDAYNTILKALLVYLSITKSALKDLVVVDVVVVETFLRLDAYKL